MSMTMQRHGWLTSTLRLVPVIAIAAAAIAMAPTDARAQATNINTFACVSGSTAVTLDASGLGNKDLCVIATITQDVDCACAGGGGNCPNDAKKQTESTATTSATRVEAKNGSVKNTTVTPTVTTPSCTDLSCPSGQRARLIQFSSSGDFRVCSIGQGEACNVTTCPASEALVTAENCGPANTTVFSGKNDSCVDLFPPQ